jgi:hypothetical protein
MQAQVLRKVARSPHHVLVHVYAMAYSPARPRERRGIFEYLERSITRRF